MQVWVLGTLTIDHGRIVPAPRDRVVLSALVLRLGKPVSLDSLASALWAGAPPASSTKVILGCVMRLRRLVSPARIETTPMGYRLVPEGVDLDSERFERLITRGCQLLELSLIHI